METATNSLARFHQRNKHGERHHKCNQCAMGFLYPKDLKRHQTTHKKEKCFSCKLCARAYTREDNLKRHMDNNHPDHTPPNSSLGGQQQ
jgi:hypothetical protein